MYVPLWVKSNFSFLEGASHPEELVAQSQALGLSAMALTDRDGVYGVVRAHLEAQQRDLQLLLGAQLSIEDEHGHDNRIILLARDRGGYANLCRLLSAGRRRCPKGSSIVYWPEIWRQAAGLIALLPGPGSGELAQPVPSAEIENLRAAFGDWLYVLVTRHRRPEEYRHETALRHWAGQHRVPVVAGVEVLYHQRRRQPLQDVLTCIRHGVTLDTAGRRLQANAEQVLLSPADFADLFADDPEAVARTLDIARACSFSLTQLRYRYPSERLPDGTTTSEQLRRLTLAGAAQRYHGPPPADVSRQLASELALIDELDYSGYFMTMHELVSFCRAQGILCQGRGSAANSAVCFCLGITAVDPVRMGLLFERFLSRERAEPPDIDLDIEHHRREEVIQHVYDLYGRDHAAMVAVVICYRPRSAIREVGKVLGLPETALDQLAKQTDYSQELLDGLLQQSGLDTRGNMHRHFTKLVDEIQDFPRHLSIHPGGFLLGHEPVHDLVPIENGAMAERTVIQWDKDDIEALGLFKVDLLGLGALTHLHHSFEMIAAHYGRHCSMAEIPADDPQTFAMIRRGDTVGVFQIESRAQMSMLPRMQPTCYYDLVIEVSIVRPGPIVGGMVHPYLRRRRGEEAVDYPHPDLEPVLRKTLGVPLFQEQVMRLAMIAADYTPGEADQLRRDMAAWKRKGRLEAHQNRLISRMLAKGISREFAERVFQQISGFGEYGFPESHAASFALIAYATAWLRCHYPAVFTAALLNAQPMGFYSPATIVDDAKRHGVEIRPVEVLCSDWNCTLERRDHAEPAVRMGLRYIKGLGQHHWTRLQRARAAAPFISIPDLMERTQLDQRALTNLAQAGAFHRLQADRRQCLWQVQARTRDAAASLPLPDTEVAPTLPVLDEFELISWDYHHAGHSTASHPLAPFRAALTAQRLPTAREVLSLNHDAAVRYAGVVICRQRPSTASGVVFMTLEDETGFVNLILWPKTVQRFRRLVRTVSFLGVSGKIQSDQGVVHILARNLWQPKLQPPTARSRDFC